MYLVKITKNFGYWAKKGEIIEVSNARTEVLVKKGAGEVIKYLGRHDQSTLFLERGIKSMEAQIERLLEKIREYEQKIQANKERDKEGWEKEYGLHKTKKMYWGMRSRIMNNSEEVIEKGESSWEHLVGYTLEELRAHLESKFQKGMNWHNYGSYWEIDHIKPIHKFEIGRIGDKEFKRCWSLKNLQPITKEDHKVKHGR